MQNKDPSYKSKIPDKYRPDYVENQSKMQNFIIQYENIYKIINMILRIRSIKKVISLLLSLTIVCITIFGFNLSKVKFQLIFLPSRSWKNVINWLF
jgi:hypothetical protein